MAGRGAKRWSWRWGFYTASMVLAFSVVVTGTMSSKNDWKVGDIVTAVLYVLWVGSFGVFSYSSYRLQSHFLIISLYHAVCIAVVMTFFASLQFMDKEDYYLWIPVCVVLGVVLGAGIADIFSVLWKVARPAPQLLRRWLLSLLMGMAADRPLPRDEEAGGTDITTIPGAGTNNSPYSTFTADAPSSSASGPSSARTQRSNENTEATPLHTAATGLVSRSD